MIQHPISSCVVECVVQLSDWQPEVQPDYHCAIGDTCSLSMLAHQNTLVLIPCKFIKAYTQSHNLEEVCSALHGSDSARTRLQAQN